MLEATGRVVCAYMWWVSKKPYEGSVAPFTKFLQEYQKRPLQRHLALPRTAASILGALWRILSVFITLSLLNRQQRAVFRRSFRISDAVGTLFGTVLNCREEFFSETQ